MVKKVFVGQSKQYNIPVVVSDEGLVYIGSFSEALEDVQNFLNSKVNFEWELSAEKTDSFTQQLDDYIEGRRQVFTCPIDFQWGTLFQQTVWRHLLTIPFGASTSYSEVSQAIGRPQAVRAVGSAIGKNPLSIIVPCHRVLTKDGRLGGYSGGLDMKRRLLAIEKINYKA